MKEKVLVTGASGFIGSHLCIELYEKGYTVIGMDLAEFPSKTLMDYKASKSGDDLKQLEERMKLFTIDLSTYDGSSNPFSDIELIYHLASPIGVKNIINNSGATFRAAQSINKFMDDLCLTYNIPIIYASSSEVFGANNVAENTSYNIKKFNDNPRWSYAAAKVHGEFLFGSGDYPSAVVRFFNVVGPGQITDGMIIPTFIKQATNNETLTILEDGIRSYCDIREAIDKIVPIGEHLMRHKEQSKYNKQDFNIGNSENVSSASSLAKLIRAIYESDSEIVYDEDYRNIEILKTRTLVNDNDLINELDVTSYTLAEIIENIKGVSDEEAAYVESLDNLIGEE